MKHFLVLVLCEIVVKGRGCRPSAFIVFECLKNCLKKHEAGDYFETISYYSQSSTKMRIIRNFHVLVFK